MKRANTYVPILAFMLFVAYYASSKFTLGQIALDIKFVLIASFFSISFFSIWTVVSETVHLVILSEKYSSEIRDEEAEREAFIKELQENL